MRKRVEERDMVVVKALGEIMEACEKYKDVFLMCFCAPKKCHGEEIITILSSVLLNEALETGGPPR